ncbi:hypothetical protein [Nitrosopumilus sp.]|uniref:hypothetical protein n=1 Tax=Nitrosopumilus sp. TaxID=2024843 RepID=UPI0034A06CED
MQTLSEFIILFSKNSNISEIQTMNQNNDYSIISLDYDGHKILQSENIEHEISDTYLDSKDLQTIQKLSYKFAKWFEDKKISKILEYEGINLGLLIQVEFNYFLVQFIKFFFEISKISSQFPQATFFVSKSLYDLTSLFSNKVHMINDKVDNYENFYYDSVHIPLQLGNKTFRIKISKNSYKKLQNVFDKIINFMFSPKDVDFKNSKNSILLVEFDTIRYQSIFKESRNSKLNTVGYSRRRPAIWNLESYSIIKNSGCKVLSSSILFNNELKQIITNDHTSIESMISLLLSQEKFFKFFFMINNKTVWPALKDTFKTLIIKRFHESILEIQLAKKILTKYNFSSILVWSEIGSTEQIMVKLAKKFGIKVVVLQHGLFFDSNDVGAFDMNESQGVFPHDADYYIVWGDIEKNHAIKGGIPEEKILPLGSPIFDNLPSNSISSEEYILLATSGPVQENAFDLTVKTIEKNRQVIREICSIVNKMGKKLVIKIHPSPDEFDPTQLAQSINSQFVVFKTGDISKLIANSSIFVVIDVSTVMLNAQMMKKPVISIITKDSDYGFPTIITSNSCVSINIEEFEKTLNSILTDKKLSNSIINKGEEYSKQYVFNQGCSALKLLDFLNSLQ